MDDINNEYNQQDKQNKTVILSLRAASCDGVRRQHCIHKEC